MNDNEQSPSRMLVKIGGQFGFYGDGMKMTAIHRQKLGLDPNVMERVVMRSICFLYSMRTKLEGYRPCICWFLYWLFPFIGRRTVAS